MISVGPGESHGGSLFQSPNPEIYVMRRAFRNLRSRLLSHMMSHAKLDSAQVTMQCKATETLPVQAPRHRCRRSPCRNPASSRYTVTRGRSENKTEECKNETPAKCVGSPLHGLHGPHPRNVLHEDLVRSTCDEETTGTCPSGL